MLWVCWNSLQLAVRMRRVILLAARSKGPVLGAGCVQHDLRGAEYAASVPRQNTVQSHGSHAPVGPQGFCTRARFEFPDNILSWLPSVRLLCMPRPQSLFKDVGVFAARCSPLGASSYSLLQCLPPTKVEAQCLKKAVARAPREQTAYAANV